MCNGVPGAVVKMSIVFLKKHRIKFPIGSVGGSDPFLCKKNICCVKATACTCGPTWTNVGTEEGCYTFVPASATPQPPPPTPGPPTPPVLPAGTGQTTPVMQSGDVTAFTFNTPYDVFVDNDLAIYVADTANHAIRKIVVDQVSTLSDSVHNWPSGVCVNRNTGTVYIGDTDNHVVQQIIAGAVEVLAGGLPAGFKDGIGTEARFIAPAGCDVDANGVLYVADSQGFRIRNIVGNDVQTYAGTSNGYKNVLSSPLDAEFRLVMDCALDNNGNHPLYVADTNNHAIRYVTTGGAVLTLAGAIDLANQLTQSTPVFGDTDSTSQYDVRIKWPNGVDVCDGLVFVADTTNNKIRIVYPHGGSLTLAGDGTPAYKNDVGKLAQLKKPKGVACIPYGSDVVVADSNNHYIRGFNVYPLVITLAGNGAGSSTKSSDLDVLNVANPLTADFVSPVGIAVDSSANGDMVFVGQAPPVSITDNVVRKIDVSSGEVSIFAGGNRGFKDNTDKLSAEFDMPGALLYHEGSLYVSEAGNHVIRKIFNNVELFAGSAPDCSAPPCIPNPGDVEGDALIMARFDIPRQMAIDHSGNMYVADENNHKIRFINGGIVGTLAGAKARAGLFDGIGGSAKFTSPQGVAVDVAGNIYVADTMTHTIRMVTGLTNVDPGVVTTIAGTYEPPAEPVIQSGFGDTAVGLSAKFERPIRLVVDSEREILYVSDKYNNKIRTVSTVSPYAVTTLAGTGNAIPFYDGVSTEASFSWPIGITIDYTGRILYVIDDINNRVRKIILRPPPRP